MPFCSKVSKVPIWLASVDGIVPLLLDIKSYDQMHLFLPPLYSSAIS